MHAIVGNNDPAVGEEYVRSSWMRTFSDSTLDVIADGGHYVMWEAPVALLTSIEKRLLADQWLGDQSVCPEADKIRDRPAERTRHLRPVDEAVKPGGKRCRRLRCSSISICGRADR